MSERSWPPFDSPNWGRTLRYAIAFVSRHFGSVREAETKIYSALVSGDLLSIYERADGVREPLTGWGKIEFSITSYIDHPGELMRDDDIDIARGLEALDANLIFVWWPDVERLCGLKAKRSKRRRRRKKTQPKPVATQQPKPVATQQPELVEGEPSLRQRMIIAILRKEYGDDFTTDDMAGKEAVVTKHWGAECKARRVSYSLPHRTTIEYTIKDYLARPSAYLRPLIKAT